MRRWVWLVLGVLLAGVLSLIALLVWVKPLDFLNTTGGKFDDYFQNSPQQVRNLSVKDESGIDTHLTMTFELDEPLLYNTTPKLRHLEGEAARRSIDGLSECSETIMGGSLIKLDDNSSPGGATGTRGRLIIQNGTQYCVFIWNY